MGIGVGYRHADGGLKVLQDALYDQLSRAGR